MKTLSNTKYSADAYMKLLAEFEDLLYSDPDFNYSYGEFDDWIREVVQCDFNERSMKNV